MRLVLLATLAAVSLARGASGSCVAANGFGRYAKYCSGQTTRCPSPVCKRTGGNNGWNGGNNNNGGAQCKDTYSGDCSKYKWACNSNGGDWFAKQCKKTCGKCGGGGSNPNPSRPRPPKPSPPNTNPSTPTGSGSCIGSGFNFNEYYGWQSHIDFLKCLASRHSDRAQIIDIGNSVEGRTLKVIKIGRPHPYGSVKPAIWVDGGIHAREWISPASVEYIVHQLVEKYNSPENKKLVDNFDIYVLPILNPDGYEFSRTRGNRMWRKNRAKNSGRSCVGVDLNRNWGYKWGGKGASSNPCSNTYRGKTAFSEPESKAVRDFIMRQKRNQKLLMYLSYHSYGQDVLYGWGYEKIDAPNADQQRAMGNVAAKAMRNANGGSFRVGGSGFLFGAIAGGSDDWALGSAGFTYSYTIELPPKGNPGFRLPSSRILPVGKAVHAGFTAMLTKLMNDARE